MEVMKNSGRATQLEVLDVYRNCLQGHLPMNLVTYDNLTAINLGNNQFSGQIPVEYGQKMANKWRSLFLDHNFLVGSLPPQFSNNAARIRGMSCTKLPQLPGKSTLLSWRAKTSFKMRPLEWWSQGVRNF
ncbi:unnamed protein product [Camellia sinensis]